MLKYLRYNIRNPENEIEKRYPKELTEVYMQKSPEVGDVPSFSYIENKNDSIVKIRLFEPNKLPETI